MRTPGCNLVANLPRSPSRLHIKLFARVHRLFETLKIDRLSLIHLPDQSIDVLLPVAKITALNEMSELACVETASWVRQLEWPQEVGCLLEVGSDGENLYAWLNAVTISKAEYHIPRESSLRYRRCRIDRETPQ